MICGTKSKNVKLYKDIYSLHALQKKIDKVGTLSAFGEHLDSSALNVIEL